jgi:ssDNA-binding Zn-finger/Zn-ribbon topoisomerase 1
VPKPCPKCGTAYLLVRERKGGSFYVCEAEGCDYDASAGDLEQYPLATEVTEEARQAALVAATMKVAAKKTPRRRKEPADAEPAAAVKAPQAAKRAKPEREPKSKAKAPAGARAKAAPKKAKK